MEDSVGETIIFYRPDKKTCPGYLAVPEAAPDAPGFVVLQEWWGLNDQIKHTADRFAAAGYRALAADLYRGKIAKNPEEARQLISGLNFPDVADQDIRGAMQFLNQYLPESGCRRLLCWRSLRVTRRCPRARGGCGSLFLWHPAARLRPVQTISVPLSCHFANLDERYTPAKVNELEAALKQSKSQFELYRYDAHHGFMNEKRPKAYDPRSAKLAWDRTLAFLRNSIG
jgi:carboxymethylenebutenolidase